jgi:glycosyltransferase involved in cell wall biosynthesis
LKILFINKYDIHGGAGIAAFKLAQNLSRYYKTQNSFIVGIKKSNDGNIFQSRDNKFQIEVERGLNFLLSTFGLQYFFFPFSTKRILGILDRIKPDIINLHNLHGGYFKTSLLKTICEKYKVVWSLHDMWALTGSAAYTFGDESWKEMRTFKAESGIYPYLGINTNKFLMKHKKMIYDSSEFTIVTASEWMYQNVKNSPLLNSKPTINIPYGIDLNLYSNEGRAKCREKFGIPVNGKVLIFGAEKLDDHRKGISELIKILEIMSEDLKSSVHLIVLGNGDDLNLNLPSNFIVRKVGYVSDEILYSEYLKSADIFLFPSKDDNLPVMPINSIACGTPVIAFDVGGCSDIIEDNFNGYLIAPFNLLSFAKKTISLINDDGKLKSFSINASSLAKEKFSEKRMAEQYYNLFKNVLNENVSENKIKSGTRQ